MKVVNTHTAVVIIDPQNDVLSPRGKTWETVGASVIENRTVPIGSAVDGSGARSSGCAR